MALRNCILAVILAFTCSLLLETSFVTAAAANSTEHTNGVKPIIFMHGIFDNPKEADFLMEYIPKNVPGALIYKITLFHAAASALNIKLQLETIIPRFQEIMNNHTDTGVVLLCYSQGGFICRAAVEMMENHNAHTLITLAGPLAGQYGVTSKISWLVPNRDRSYLWKFFYTKDGQWISFADYWNDPHHQKEFSNNKTDVLLARLNNQTQNPSSFRYKQNFLKLKTLVLVGGPNDTIITPWQSSHFGFYDKNETVRPMESQQWYVGDDFGLKTLNERNAVHRFTFPGVIHTHWPNTQKVFDVAVIPYIKAAFP